MKPILLLFLMASAFSAVAQNVQEETLYTNERHVVVLKFKKPIVKGLVGSDNFVLAYNTNQQENIATITGIKGNSTNLFVITSDGLNYSFKIAYKSVLENYYYLIDKRQAINYKEPTTVKTEITPKKGRKSRQKKEATIALEPMVSEEMLVEKMSKNCDDFLDKKKFYQNTFDVKDGVKLQLYNIFYDQNQLYFLFELKNKSAIDYDVNYLKFYKTLRKSKRVTMEQRLELPQEPNDLYPYTCNKPDKIAGKNSQKFVYVFEKFTLSKQNKILVELNEHNGERNLTLEIDARKINQPN